MAKDNVWPYLFPGVLSLTLMTFHIPTPSRMSRWNRSSDTRPPDPVAPPYITILFGYMLTAPWAALADGDVPVAESKLYYFKLFARILWPNLRCMYYLWWRIVQYFLWRRRINRLCSQHRALYYAQTLVMEYFQRLPTSQMTFK